MKWWVYLQLGFLFWSQILVMAGMILVWTDTHTHQPHSIG